jgi:hypothetical protein
MISPEGSTRYFALAAIILALMLAARFIVAYLYLLPSPVADPAYFITASANYCTSGFLGTTAYPIDPSGQARMIWHGFVSPMLFGKLNVGCEAPHYYLIFWFIEALTSAAILVLARWRGLALLPTLGLAAFALAAQNAIGFRPESLAILLVVFAELAIFRQRAALLGVIGGTLLCTQPTVAGLYGLSMLLLRPEWSKRWLAIGLGASFAILLLIAIYPFPILDLVSGIGLQAKRLVSRTDGSVLWYYLLIPSLPVWSLLLIGTLVLAARRRPLALFLLPVLWFLGPRVPPVYYNLVPLCLLYAFVALEWATPKTALAVGIASLAIGIVGLSYGSLRDALTMYRYGDTFSSTSAQVARLAGSGVKFSSVPSFLTLTNPELRFTDPARHAAAIAPGDAAVRITAVNGMPRSPCPENGTSTPAVSLGVGKLTLFNSNSGWMVYVCREQN